MEEKKPISSLIAGLLIAAVLIVYSCILYFMGMEQAGMHRWLQLLIILIGLIVFVNMYGNAKNNQVTFGNLFGYGFKTTAVLALIMILFTVIFLLLFPDVKEKGFETARQQLEESGNRTQSEIDEAMEIGRKMFWPITIGSILLIYAIIGVISSLIGAAITKKKPVNPVDQLDMR